MHGNNGKDDTGTGDGLLDEAIDTGHPEKDAERADWHLTDRIDHEFGRGDPFAAAVRTTRMPMALTDPRMPDNPLVFVNQAFQDLTGYRREEILGRNCRFLQGPDTDPDTVRELREAIDKRELVKVELLNYRKDGSKFWNELQVCPVFGKDGEVMFYFASQIDMTERVETQKLVSQQEAVIEREVARRTQEQRDALERQRLLTHEVDHRVKNNLAMISSLVRLEAGSTADPQCSAVLERIQGRVDAMGAVHRQLYMAGDGDSFALSSYTEELVRRMVGNFTRDDVQLELAIAPDIAIDSGKGAPYGLLLNELLTNAFKHAFREAGGVLRVTVADNSETVEVTIADNGPGMDMNVPRSASIGSRLVERLVMQIGATKHVTSKQHGTTIAIRIPKNANA